MKKEYSMSDYLNETGDAPDAFTKLREEVAKLRAENANLRAMVAGQTAFHSDEAVNAELGRLREDIKGNLERYSDRLVEIHTLRAENERLLEERNTLGKALMEIESTRLIYESFTDTQRLNFCISGAKKALTGREG
jgi:regulator of replication initiation timing